MTKDRDGVCAVDVGSPGAIVVVVVTKPAPPLVVKAISVNFTKQRFRRIWLTLLELAARHGVQRVAYEDTFTSRRPNLRDVGRVQSWGAGALEGACIDTQTSLDEMAHTGKGPTMWEMRVPPQGAEQAQQAWAILGRPGQGMSPTALVHVKDGCAIALAAIGRMEEE